MSDLESIKITLYHAKWCGYCVKFMPEWLKLVDAIKGIKSNDITLELIAIEESDFGKLSSKPSINGESVQSFPTIKITLKYKNGEKKEVEYKGERSMKDLIAFVRKIIKL